MYDAKTGKERKGRRKRSKRENKGEKYKEAIISFLRGPFPHTKKKFNSMILAAQNKISNLLNSLIMAQHPIFKISIHK